MKMKYILAGLASLSVMFVSSAALAAEAADAGSKGPYAALSAALAIGLAAFGGALGQGKTAASALDGISRNPAAQPKIFIPMIIGLALIESLVIYALLIAFRLS